MPDRGATSPLRALAAAVGIMDSYVDQTGNETRVTSDDTRRALLAALSIDASTDEAARDSLEQLRAVERAELVAPVRVVRIDDPARRSLSVRAPGSRDRSGPWRLETEAERGTTYRADGPWRGDTDVDITLPELPLGYHKLRLSMSSGGHEWVNEQTLIIVPARCTSPDDLLGGGDACGVVTNLYTLRSERNWGIGDFTDLGAVAEWCGANGGDFVGLSPLHALLNRGADISPYSPVSRLFRNPIYIDVNRVPELEAAPQVRDTLASSDFTAGLSALRDDPAVRYDEVTATKTLALGALHRAFAERVRNSDDARSRDYARFVAAHEPHLTTFALWMTIAEQLEYGADSRTWPAELRDRSSAATQRFADSHAERVDYHRWLQFEADRQLGISAKATRASGMRIGLYQDLAIGTSSGGADTWAFPQLFVRDACVGAPPDPYALAGQNWGFPPIDPRVLRRSGYRYWIDVLRAAFAHAGALRVDHILGSFRLFWIPNTSSTGAYVRYPTDDLLGILALESARHRALVIGEDLGTVPPEVPGILESRGILSSKVLEFERDERGDFKPSRGYPSLSLATVNTHDMAPFAGFWSGRDIAIRNDVGLFADDESVERARATRDREKASLIGLLAAESVLPSAQEPSSNADLRAAVHAFLARSPARLVGIALDDVAGETEPVNVPGVTGERYASWTRKMTRPIESIVNDGAARAALPNGSFRRPNHG